MGDVSEEIVTMEIYLIILFRARGKPQIAGAIFDTIMHPDLDWRYSRSPRRAAFQLVKGTDLSFYEYLAANPKDLEVFSSSIRVSIYAPLWD
jgi:hypothetical protein